MLAADFQNSEISGTVFFKNQVHLQLHPSQFGQHHMIYKSTFHSICLIFDLRYVEPIKYIGCKKSS